MKDFKVNFSGRGHDYTEEDIATVAEAMRNADPLTQGRHQVEFEKKFGEWNGGRHCFAVSSCTAALELSAVLCCLKKDDEVILPAHTFCATAIPFARTGAKLVWADIDIGTRVISAKTVEPLITKRTKVIIAVHLYGLMAQMPEIMELAKEHGLLVVEDCAQAPGASVNGVKAGNFGDFACFSFHTHKNMTTLGEGGMLVVKDDKPANLVPGLRHNGIRSFDYERKRYWVPAMSNVDFDIDNVWPYNFCVGEVQCALGTKLLGRIDAMNAERNGRAQRFMKSMAYYPELSFQKVPEGYFHCYHLLSAMYKSKSGGSTSHDFIEMMAGEFGIKTVVQYHPLNRYPMFIKAGFSRSSCPNTDLFFDNMVSFPFHHWISESDINYTIDSVKKTIERLRSI